MPKRGRGEMLMLEDITNKRQRRGGGLSDKKKAIMAAIYREKKYPRKKYYTLYRPRTEESKAKFGETWAKATKAQRAARKEADMLGYGLYMRGRGGFFGNLWNKRSAIFDAGDAAAKAMGYGHISGPLRKALRASGIGSYDVATNDLINGGNQNTFQAPSFTPVSDTGEIMMSNREYISNVYGPSSSGFSVQSYDLNPGLESTFPFLAQIAANYSEYEFKQLIFSYKSTVTDFQTTNGIAGQVLTATQYNTDEDVFRDKQSMMVYHGAASAKSTGNIMSGVECDPRKLSGTPGKFVRHQGLPRNEDQKEYDLGRFNIATVDFPAVLQNQAIGELWVSYTVVLRRPKLVVSRGLAISQDLHGLSPLPGQQAVADTSLVAAPGANNVCVPWSKTAACVVAASANSIGVLVDVPTLEVDAAQLEGPLKPNLGMVVGTGYATWPGITAGKLREIELTFPADYSGDVRIKYQAVAHDVDSAPKFASAGARSVGQIEPISDMLIGIAGGTVLPAGSYITQAQEQADQSVALIGSGVEIKSTSTSNTNTTAFLCQLELHVRVQQSRDGIDNKVFLQIMNTKSGGAPEPVINASLEISEYNSGMTRKGTDLVDWEIPSTEEGRSLPAPQLP
jgi:hypothetical protein